MQWFKFVLLLKLSMKCDFISERKFVGSWTRSSNQQMARIIINSFSYPFTVHHNLQVIYDENEVQQHPDQDTMRSCQKGWAIEWVHENVSVKQSTKRAGISTVMRQDLNFFIVCFNPTKEEEWWWERERRKNQRAKSTGAAREKEETFQCYLKIVARRTSKNATMRCRWTIELSPNWTWIESFRASETRTNEANMI